MFICGMATRWVPVAAVCSSLFLQCSELTAEASDGKRSDNGGGNGTGARLALYLNESSQTRVQALLQDRFATDTHHTPSAVTLHPSPSSELARMVRPALGTDAAMRVQGLLRAYSAKPGSHANPVCIVGTGIVSSFVPIEKENFAPSLCILGSAEMCVALPSAVIASGVQLAQDPVSVTLGEGAGTLRGLRCEFEPLDSVLKLRGVFCSEDRMMEGYCKVDDVRAEIEEEMSRAEAEAEAEGDAAADQGECPLCIFMKNGPCKDRFVEWDSCMVAHKSDEATLHAECVPVTQALLACIEAHPYYDVITSREDAPANKPEDSH